MVKGHQSNSGYQSNSGLHGYSLVSFLLFVSSIQWLEIKGFFPFFQAVFCLFTSCVVSLCI